MVLAELGGKLRESLRKLQQTARGGGSGSTTADGGSGGNRELVNEVLADICRALIAADVNVRLVAQMRTAVLERIDQHTTKQQSSSSAGTTNAAGTIMIDAKIVQRAVVDELTNLLSARSTKPTVLKRGKTSIVLFVGLQGAGKTTTVAKYAFYHAKKGFKVAMVCADTFRAGAFDQLKQNATKLRIPFYGSYTTADPVEIAKAGVEKFRAAKYELILVDTSGRHKQQSALLDEMGEIAVAIQPIAQTVLVVDGTQGQAVYDQAAAFHAASAVGAVIVTKLDGHAVGGGALSAVAATDAPVVFTGTGEHFDDLEVFAPDRFVSKLLGFGDLKGLMEAMKTDDKTMERMQKGEFTLRDMYNQFEKVLNMGPLNRIAGMIPGMPEYLVPKGGDADTTARLKKFMVIMDSMNKAELDGKVNLHDDTDQVQSRILRIARGSGSHPNEVKLLLLSHKQFEGMVSKMGKSMGAAGGNASAGSKLKQQQLAAQMRKNPLLIQQRINQMDPRILQQLGGRENVMAMMQQMARGGGMPSMESMMSGGEGFPGMAGMPGLGGMMPGMGGGGMPGMGGGGMPNLGGMDMQAMMKMAQQMGMGGMPPGGPARR